MTTSDEAARADGVKLLPCPFCGQQPTMEPSHGGKPTKVMIVCYANSVMGHGQRKTCAVAPSVTGETPKAAARNWNTRTHSQACSDMLVALEGLALAPVRYNGNTIEIEAATHWDGIQKMLNARKAIEGARSAGIGEEEK